MENISIAVRNNSILLVDVLYRDELSNIEKLKELIDFYGIPHIRTINGYNYFPKEIEDSVDEEINEDEVEEKPAMEFVELIGQRIVLDRLLGVDAEIVGTICTLRPQCELSEDNLVDEFCYDRQWDREIACPFKIISDNWNLKEKI